METLVPESFFTKAMCRSPGLYFWELFLWVFNEKIADDIFRVFKCLTFAERVDFKHFKSVVRFHED